MKSYRQSAIQCTYLFFVVRCSDIKVGTIEMIPLQSQIMAICLPIVVAFNFGAKGVTITLYLSRLSPSIVNTQRLMVKYAAKWLTVHATSPKVQLLSLM